MHNFLEYKVCFFIIYIMKKQTKHLSVLSKIPNIEFIKCMDFKFFEYINICFKYREFA